jgi:hypothetical protein
VEVNEELVPWLRQRIRERRYLAGRAIELGNAAVWTEQSSGVLVTGEPTETDHWHGTWAMGDSSLTRLMEANDPRDTIARCEAELAVLDEHAAVPGYDPGGPVCLVCGVPAGPGYEDGVVRWPCRTVRLLGYGYRFRPGYREAQWKP